jgi:hypothetical protein
LCSLRKAGCSPFHKAVKCWGKYMALKTLKWASNCHVRKQGTITFGYLMSWQKILYEIFNSACHLTASVHSSNS